MKVIIILILIGILLVLAYKSYEKMCVETKFGPVSNIPYSLFTNSNMALVHSDTIGQAPLGDPRFWVGTGSPVTQGQYSYNEDGSQNLPENYYPKYVGNPF